MRMTRIRPKHNEMQCFRNRVKAIIALVYVSKVSDKWFVITYKVVKHSIISIISVCDLLVFIKQNKFLY